MEIEIVVIDKKTGAQYYSTNDAKEAFDKLLKEDLNNVLKVGFKIILENEEYEILNIAMTQISPNLIDDVNAYLKLYVEKI